MLTIRAFHPDDPLRIDAQSNQKSEYLFGTNIGAGSELVKGFAVSAWEDGTCIGAAGILEFWHDRAAAWCLMSQACSPHMLEITRIVKAALDFHPAARIEMTVFADFPAGIRWARMLGFVQETPEPMRKFADGRDAYLFARVR